MKQTIKIDGQIGGWSVYPEDVIAEIEEKEGDIEIILNSVGGSVMGGISIANAIRNYNKGTVTVVVDAMSASIASYFMMFADKIIVHDNTTVMIHNAWLISGGDFRELRKAADISEGLSSIIAKAYISRTSKSEDEIKSMMDEETYFYGEDIVSNGFADEMIESKTETNEAEAKAMILENIKACNNALIQNETLDLEAVAKLIPKKEEEISKDEKLKEIENTNRLADLQAKQKRDREILILKTKGTL